MENRWAEINTALSDFRKYLADDFQPLSVFNLYDFGWSTEAYKLSRKENKYGECGVYLFFDEHGKLLYVGKASWTFDKRIWAHGNITEARFIDCIPFKWDISCFCLALEYYLISRFNPPYNTHGREYGYQD